MQGTMFDAFKKKGTVWLIVDLLSSFELGSSKSFLFFVFLSVDSHIHFIFSVCL